MRQRAEVLAHVQNTITQYNLPPLPKKLAYKTNRIGVAEHFPDPMVRKGVEVDLSLLDHFDLELKELERTLERMAKVGDPQTYYLLRTIPGVGRILAMTILYEVGTIGRFPRVQDFVSYSRLVRPSKRSAGKPVGGSSGKKIGNAHLKWAFSEATVLLLRYEPDVKRRLDRLAQKHGKGKALSILSAKLGRSVYYMLKRGEAFELNRFLAH